MSSDETPDEIDEPNSKQDEVEVEFHQALKDHVGEFGYYQIFFTLYNLWTACVAALNTFLPVFIAAIPKHRCSLPGILNCSEEQLVNGLIPTEIRHGEELPSQCKYYNYTGNNLTFNLNFSQTMDDNCTFNNLSSTFSIEKCDKWIYDNSLYSSTIINEWDLVCSRAYLAAHANSVYWIGVMVGLLFGSHLADRLGRKPIGVAGELMSIICSIATAFSPNYTVFLVLRCLTAMFQSIKESGIGVASLEAIGEPWRIIYFVCDQIGWSAGYFLIDILAYYERHWRYLQIYIVLMEIPAFLLFVFYFKESARWLLTQDRRDEALKQLRLIALRNRRKLPNNISLVAQKEVVKVSVLDLFRWPNMRIVTFILFYYWFSMGLVYYGISLHTGHLGGNPFVTFFISGLADLISGLLALRLYNRFGRINPISFGNFISGLVLLATIYIPTDIDRVVITATMVGKFVSNIAGGGTWLYTMELYPTSIRSIGTHICSMLARVGAIGASYIGILVTVDRKLPLIVFGASAILAGFLTLMLPETKDEPLTQTMREGEQFVKKNLCYYYKSCCRCFNKKEQIYNLNYLHNGGEKIEQQKALLTSTEEDEL